MDSASEHNHALQQTGKFSAADLEANKQGRYSPAQLKQFEEIRSGMRETANQYDNKGPIISLIFGFGFLCFVVVLYFVGVFDILQSILGGLFLPGMAGAALLAALFIFVIVPRQYQSTVEMTRAMGTPLAEMPAGEIVVFEARAYTYVSQPGAPRSGGRSRQKTYILQMDNVDLRISSALYEIIQPKRLYRVYAEKNEGWWSLLSLETLE